MNNELNHNRYKEILNACESKELEKIMTLSCALVMKHVARDCLREEAEIYHLLLSV